MNGDSKSVFRVFVSSPGDVDHERLVVERVLSRLRAEYAAGLPIEPVFWEHEPLRATEHPQDQLKLPSECDVVICILWSRLGTRLPGHFRRPDGSAFESGTAFEFEDAARGFAARGRPDLLVYHKSETPVVSLADERAVLERLSQKQKLDRFLDTWFKDSGTGLPIAALHRFQTTEEFEKLVDAHLRKVIARLVPAREQEIRIRNLRESWTRGCPFRGLEVFDFEHAQIFFGRTQPIADIVSNLRKRSLTHGDPIFITVLGMSGCGKSSLIRAGVVPLLVRPGVVDGASAWGHCVFRPSDSPRNLLGGLARCLLATAPFNANATRLGFDVDDLAQTLRERPDAGCDLVSRTLACPSGQELPVNRNHGPSGWKLALVVDQMEELFTLDTITADERNRFVGVLRRLSESGTVWVLTTLRSNFYHRCEEIPDLLVMMRGLGQYHLGPPTPADIGAAVRMPAIAAGLTYEKHPITGEPLDDRLRDAAITNPGSLPLLEFTLTELYARCHVLGVLTHAAYDDIGGVEGALCSHAERIVGGLPDQARQRLPSVFQSLITTGKGDRETVSRTYAQMDEVCSDKATWVVVEKLVEGRLLATQRDNFGHAVVFVTHEALLDHWPRLTQWIRDNRQFIQTRARVTENATRWRAEGNPDDLLIPEGRLLDEAETMVRACPEYFKKDLLDYVATSREKTASAQAAKRTEKMASIGTLAAGMAHAIRNALVSIQTFYQLLPERYDDKEFRDNFASVVGTDVKTIEHIVSELLDFAHPVRGIFKPVSARALLEECIDLLKDTLQRKNIAVSTEWGATQDSFLGDADMLKQAFLNFLLNALDAMEQGGILSVSTTDHNAPFGKGGSLAISIEDHGAGIKQKDLPRIFDPFFTTKSGRKGLGLSVAHGIIQVHEGMIEVESRRGKGSTFRMVFLRKQPRTGRKKRRKGAANKSVDRYGSAGADGG